MPLHREFAAIAPGTAHSGTSPSPTTVHDCIDLLASDATALLMLKSMQTKAFLFTGH
jgi:hypothetical protein